MRLVVLAVSLMLTVASAMAQTNSVSAGQQSNLGVDPIPGATYTWDLYIDDVTINFATVPGNCPVSDAYFVGGNSSPTVSVMWETPGIYYFRVIVVGATGCQNIKVGMMEVIDCPPPAVTFAPCFDLITSVEAKPFRLSGGLPLGGVYSGGPWVNSAPPATFDPSLAPTGQVPVTYTYTNAAGCSNSATVNIENYAAQSPSFTCGTDPWTDIRDNKSYPTILIGTQCWLAANLDYGTVIPSSQVQTDNCVNEKYCYNNSTTAGGCQDGYGFYQWDEMMKYDNTPASQGVCPPGWHVPEEPEWKTLFDFYLGVAFAGRPLQDTNPPGFHALPSGVLYLNDTWSFKGLATIFWSSTTVGPVKAVSHGMNTVDNSVSYYESLRVNAFPVRCVKN